MLDTPLAVDHLRSYRPATLLIEDLVKSRESLVASELTRFELLAGARPDEHDDLESFFSVHTYEYGPPEQRRSGHTS